MKGERAKTHLRCAIYTRVSSDSGLEQEFNSLDNQREAAEAYVKSQAHEGWSLVRGRYDDGGFSGGSMERPALQKLLDDVRARRIDVIVVYKVDRLTRSLADFAKLVELFDEVGVSFVSVTQAFNTTTSMGRLTLNVLLSFAQFEREVTGERIRDKIAASKKKGLWMGGVVPLGYRVADRALHVVEEHAELVRTIFRRYLDAGSVVRLKQQLEREGVILPLRIDGTGRRTGGGHISRGHLYKILSNPIYVGQLRHKGAVHEGQQAAIVDPETWSQVQQRLAEQTQRSKGSSETSGALLAGKLFDDRGHRMSPSHASKGSRRWRYYVSLATLQGRKGEAGSVVRIPAEAVEARVTEGVSDALGKKLAETELRIAIDRVTLGAGKLIVQLAAGNADDESARTVTLPFSLTPSRRRREILQGDGDPSLSLRPMRIEARRAFAIAYGDARAWLDRLISDPGVSYNRRPRSGSRQVRAFDPADLVAGLSRSRAGASRSRGKPAARFWDQAADGPADAMAGSKSRARPRHASALTDAIPSGACSH